MSKARKPKKPTAISQELSKDFATKALMAPISATIMKSRRPVLAS